MNNVLNKYDTIIFDCDGVLLDTNEDKCLAFGKAVNEYPKDVVDAFIEHCKNNFGISRYVKFQEFFSEFLKEPFDENKYNLFLERYASECLKLYFNAEQTTEAENLLKSVHLRKNLYVASGSKESELKEVFSYRNLGIYFKDIKGSPKSKIECVEEIIKECNIEKTVLIGDSLSDYKAANHFGLDFIYMYEYTVQSIEKDSVCKENANLVIDNLSKLI